MEPIAPAIDPAHPSTPVPPHTPAPARRAHPHPRYLWAHRRPESNQPNRPQVFIKTAAPPVQPRGVPYKDLFRIGIAAGED
jgi:hypothetical protein